MKPNIILIVTDQHRLDTFHYYNKNAPCQTPALDALAEESCCFTNAYTTSPICTPARSSLHTGLYPSTTGLCTNIYQAGSTTHELADKPYLLSRRLGAQDYRCGYTGKWHLGLGKDKNASFEGQLLIQRMEQGFMAGDAYLNYGTLPTDIGFVGDDFPGHGDGGGKTPQFLYYLKNNGLTQIIENRYGGERPGDHSRGGIIVSGEETTVEYYLGKRAREITESIKGKPFFMAVNFWGPHEPYYVTQEDYSCYATMQFPPSPGFQCGGTVENRLHCAVQRPEMDWSFFQNNLRHYYAAITGIDRQIGRYIDYLKQTGLYDQSYIIVTADHGDSQGCHNGLENKSYHMYDETTKIPLMVKLPKGSSQMVTDQLANTCDIYATILDLSGDHDSYNHGISLTPCLNGEKQTVRTATVVENLGAFPIIATQRMYRSDQWKYIFNCAGQDELYDLLSDSCELHNLIAVPQYAGQLQALREGLATYMENIGDRLAPFFCKMNHLGRWQLTKQTTESPSEKEN